MVMILPDCYKENTLILLHFWQNPEPTQVSKLAQLTSSKKSPVCTAAGRF
jgi:hypothetical protein